MSENMPRTIVRRQRPDAGASRPHTIVKRHRATETATAVVHDTAPRALPRTIVRRPRADRATPEPTIRPRPRRQLPALPTALRPGRVVVLGVLTVGVLGLLSAAGYMTYRSDTFRVEAVEVAGAGYTRPEDLAARINLYGESLFTADLASAARDIEGHPLVKEAEVSRRWPNHLRITVEERQPWGTWEQAGVRYTVDREGIVMGTTIPAPAGAPHIRSFEAGTRIQGDRVDRQAIESAAQIVASAPGALGTQVTEVAFLPGKGVQVTTADGQVALLGDASGVDYKLASWAAMANDAKARGIRYTAVDLRFGNRPVLVQ